jgi:hypothetical protein
MQNLPRTHQDTPEALPYTAQWKQLKTTSLRQKVRKHITYLHHLLHLTTLPSFAFVKLRNLVVPIRMLQTIILQITNFMENNAEIRMAGRIPPNFLMPYFIQDSKRSKSHQNLHEIYQADFLSSCIK